MPGRIAAAAASPVERCLRLAGLVVAGIGHVILAKRLPSGALGCAFWSTCSASARRTPSVARWRPPTSTSGSRSWRPSDGAPRPGLGPKKLVTGAVASATASGVSPHETYRAILGLVAGDVPDVDDGPEDGIVIAHEGSAEPRNA